MHNNDFPRALRKANCSLDCLAVGKCDKTCEGDEPEPVPSIRPLFPLTPSDSAAVPRTGALRPTIRGPLQPTGIDATLGDYLRRVQLGAPGKDTNPKDSIGDKKVPLWLLSAVAKAHWAAAQFAGACKYQAYNWRVAGVRNTVYLSAMQRHMDAYLAGEDTDPVDGTHHLGNVMACAAIVLDAEAAGKLTDDRPPKVDIRKAYEFVENLMVKLRDKYKHIPQTPYTALAVNA